MPGVFFNIPDNIELIGLSGKAKCGKNYLAKHALLPMGFFPLSLAGQLKVNGIMAGGIGIEGAFYRDKTPEERDYLQKKGTEEARDVYGEDVWIKTLEAWIASYASAGWTRFVVTDVRFPNEAQWITDMGGAVIRIVGRGGLVGGTSAHRSETALDDFQDFAHTLDNSPTRQDGAAEHEIANVAAAFLDGKARGVQLYRVRIVSDDPVHLADFTPRSNACITKVA